jgi:hypothetical protein
MHEQERWDLLANANLARRLASECRDALSVEALLTLAAEYEARAHAVQREAAEELRSVA